MKLSVEIDPNSGFCAGVIKAIGNAEKYLEETGGHLFSLGAIVHNEEELARLSRKGLVALDYDDFSEISTAEGETLLIRAHGEPPETYRKAAALGFKVIDCTCPVVLNLQKNIRETYARISPSGGCIVIFGKIGHAEVLGLMGQVGGDALVVENLEMLEEAVAAGTIRPGSPVEIFSQTTMDMDSYRKACAYLSDILPEGTFTVHDTICRQVAMRHQILTDFAISHDVILFVAGSTSSNGKVLCDLCRSYNIRTYHIGSKSEVRREWFNENDKVGVCGAASTPKWLLEDVAAHLLEL